jgi:hypothetical protein
MALGDGLLALLVLGFWLFCLFDVITTDESLMRNLGKPWWLVIVLFFPVVGSIMWLVAGRPLGAGAPGLPYKGNRDQADDPRGRSGGGSRYGDAEMAAARPSVAPDDDPEFLEHVRRQSTEDKDLLRRWEDDLRRREEELKRRESGEDEPPPQPDRPTA